MIPTKFRTPCGRTITKNLFKEISANKNQVLYTLRDRESEYPCVQDLFLQEMDLSEFDFACKYFQDYAHWESVKKASWFETTYQNMRAGLEAKVQSLAHQKMLDLVESGKAGQQTLAYLANKGYLDKEKVGRPSKKQIEAQANKEIQRKAKEQEELDNLIAHDSKLKKFIKVD